MRWHTDRPPMPLGCRWCGHPPYAHEAASLPHRAHHHWEQPTPAQVHARMTIRRRLDLSGRPPVTTPIRAIPGPTVPGPTAPAAFPAWSSEVSPGRHRRPEQAVTTAAVPYRRGRPPSTRTPSGRHTPYRQGATA
ncbi:hypothetical protein AB0K21_16205 [Streptosporangium sp. NPDC049248]|uniref:hypothetical protein n=1 Tax=Streptosporangium sp. NPDC049248 TaxID=3155651 RepID=UPI003449D310